MTSLDFAGFIKDKKYSYSYDERGHEILTEIEGENSYGLRYEEFIFPTIKAVQVLFNEVDGIISQYNSLNADYIALESRVKIL